MSKVVAQKNYYSNESFKNFFSLCKPRVTALIVFTAIIGMFLATPGMVPIEILFAASIGIGFVSGAAAAFNCLIEEKIDAVMARTRGRPLPTGQVSQDVQRCRSPAVLSSKRKRRASTGASHVQQQTSHRYSLCNCCAVIASKS